MINLDHINDRDLPPLKPMVLRLWQLLNSSDAGLQEITEAMSAEPVLCARIMAIANSPLYRGIEDITTAQKALIRLGLNEVKGIVYYLTLADSVHKSEFPPAFSARRYWTHSLSTALLCEKLADYYPQLFPMPKEEKETVYLSGLLHDIGYVLMATLAPKDFATMARIWEAGDVSPLETEEAVFGVTHPVVSAKVLGLWKFPKSVQLASYAHHRTVPDNASTAGIRVLKLADYLSTEAGYSFNPLFTAEIKRADLPASLLENEYQPIVDEVSLKVETLVNQAFG